MNHIEQVLFESLIHFSMGLRESCPIGHIYCLGKAVWVNLQQSSDFIIYLINNKIVGTPIPKSILLIKLIHMRNYINQTNEIMKLFSIPIKICPWHLCEYWQTDQQSCPLSCRTKGSSHPHSLAETDHQYNFLYQHTHVYHTNFE